jgi:hypothetical protein
MRALTDQSERLDRSAAVSWLRTKLHLADVEPSVAPAGTSPISWQEVHRQDTSWLVRLRDSQVGRRDEERTSAAAPQTVLGTSELGWVRQNAALVYLLRTGRWQPVPSSPPDCWAERLVTDSSGVTVATARKILTTAFETVPQLPEAAFREPLSADEHAWAKRNSSTVHELCSGQLRGIPKEPSRTWVAAFQSAVGGTTAEIAAILAIIVNVACDAGSVMIAAE